MGMFDWLLGSDKTKEDYYSGTKWASDAGADPAFRSAGSYDKYTGGALGSDYENTVRQMLTGQLSSADETNLNNRFAKMLGVTKGTNYGAPGSSRMTAEGNLARDMALQGTLLGQNQRSAGLSASMPFMNMLSGENQFAYNANAQDANRQNLFNQGNYQYRGSMLGNYNSSAQRSADEANKSKGNLISGFMNEATKWALPGIGEFAGGAIKNLFNPAQNVTGTKSNYPAIAGTVR